MSLLFFLLYVNGTLITDQYKNLFEELKVCNKGSWSHKTNIEDGHI